MKPSIISRTVDILPALERQDSSQVWFGVNQNTFGGFLFHRSALPRRISAGFTSGLPGPRSCDKRNSTPKTSTLYPHSQERSLTAHLGKRPARTTVQRLINSSLLQHTMTR